VCKTKDKKHLVMLRKEEHHWFLECQKSAGIRTYKQEKYRDLDTQLSNIVSTYNTTSIDHVEYLHSISKCLRAIFEFEFLINFDELD